MSFAAKTIYAWSFYCLFGGLAMLLAPSVFLEIGGYPEGVGGLYQVSGIMLTVIGVYYFMMCKIEATRPLWVASVYLRFAAFGTMCLLAYLGSAPVSVLPIVAIDALSAMVTAWALRVDRLNGVAS